MNNNRSPRLEALATALAPGKAVVVAPQRDGNYVLHLIGIPSKDWQECNVRQGELNVPRNRIYHVFLHLEEAVGTSVRLFLERDAKAPYTNEFVEVNPRTLEPKPEGLTIPYTAL